MATVLAPVSVNFEPNITNCDAIAREKKVLLPTYTMALLCLVSSSTIRKWMMFVKSKNGKCHSCKKENWKLSHCHGNITVCITACLSSGTSLVPSFSYNAPIIISRDILNFVIFLHPVTTYSVWCHHFYPLNLNISWTRVAWENSQHFARSPLEPSQNDIWETSAEIPFWWRVSTQILVALLIGWNFLSVVVVVFFFFGFFFQEIFFISC